MSHKLIGVLLLAIGLMIWGYSMLLVYSGRMSTFQRNWLPALSAVSGALLSLGLVLVTV